MFAKYLKTKDLEAELLKRYSEDLYTEDLTPALQARIFKELSRVPDIDLLLKSMLKKDRIRYFNTEPAGQELIRGAFLRVMYLLKNIRKVR